MSAHDSLASTGNFLHLTWTALVFHLRHLQKKEKENETIVTLAYYIEEAIQPWLEKEKAKMRQRNTTRRNADGVSHCSRMQLAHQQQQKNKKAHHVVHIPQKLVNVPGKKKKRVKVAYLCHSQTAQIDLLGQRLLCQGCNRSRCR